jgi:hypothetical protein
MGTRLLQDRRGMALPLALFALVITSAMMMGVFYVGRLEQRMGGGSVRKLQAFEAAEAGAARALDNWMAGNYNTMAVGATTNIPLDSAGMSGGASYSGFVYKMSDTKFLVQTDGQLRVRGGRVMARQRVARLVGLNLPDIDINAAVTTRGGIQVSGSSQISGVDHIPTGWGGVCAPAGPTQAGIIDSSGNVSTSGACAGASCITGSPQILTDPTVTSTDFTVFGDLTFADLAAMANITTPGGTWNSLAPAVSGTNCNRTVQTNWGDPLNPAGACGNYFPIIYSSGNIRLTGGYGQGILLVNGDLELSGGVQFFGPVIAMGEVRSTGTGGHITGGVMSRDANLTISTFTGNSVVDYSACAVQRALRGSARAKPLDSRGWAQVY